MKKVLALTLGLLIMATGMAQNKAMEKANQRYIQLHKKYAQNTHNVMILVELADFYADTNNPMYNLPMAAKYIDSAKYNFIKIVEDNDRYDEARKAIKSGITIPFIKEKKEAITVAARNYVANSNAITELELDNFALSFASDKQIIRSIERQRILSKWREAQRINTFDSYLKFKENYPNTAEAELAESSMGQLAKNMFKDCNDPETVDLMMAPYKSISAVRQAATQHKAHLAFMQAEKSNTIKAYRDYMRDYPSGDNYATAMNRVGNLMISQFSTLNSADDLVDFVLINNDNPMADQAMERLRNLILVEQDVYALKLYLEKFPLDPARNDIYRQYYDWCVFEGDVQPIKDFAAENPDFPYELALRRDLRNAEQNSEFSLTGDYRSSEFDAYAAHMRKVTGKGLAFVTLQRVLQPYIAQKDWAGAISKMDYFQLSFESNDAERYQALRNMIKAPIDNNKLLTTEVNPSYNMSHPIVNKDGTKLYYTKFTGSKTTIGVANHVNGKNYKWITEAPLKFTNDDNTKLILFCLYDNDTKMLVGKEGDIHVAVKEDNGWRLEPALPEPINTPYVETDAFMLADGSGMLLASDRPYGHDFHKSGTLFHGDYALATDIYFIPHTKDGWGEPINLGLNVNSSYCDRSPVLSKDMKTLYFVSDGRAGFGYDDVWKTYRNDITDWTHWQTPENLGKEVNTGYRESSVSISGDDRRLIISSNRNDGTYGCYSLPSQHEKGADMIGVTIDGRAYGDQLTYLGIVDMLTHTLVHTIDIEMPQGEFQLYEDREYALVAEITGKYAPAMLFKPEKGKIVKPIEPYTAGMLTAIQQDIPMIAITFAEGSKNPDEYSTSELQRLARFLKENSDVRVELSVNVDGEDDMKCYNTALERGRKIKRIMTNTGAGTDQISISAFGNVNYKENPNTTPIVARFSRF